MTSFTNMPRAALVITVYNGEPYIGACIKAALNQTYADFEVVVVDDGSTDGTAHVCRSFHDPRLRYVNKGRIGRQRALNEGVRAANAEFIAINDADDLSLPHRLQYTVEFLVSHPNTSLVGTGFSTTSEFTGTVPNSVVENWLAVGEPVLWPTRSAVYRRNHFIHSTIVFPKRTWERLEGYDETLTLSEDYDFYLRAMQCGPVALLPGRTVHWYTNPHGIFKQRRVGDNLEVLRHIKRRARRLLELPAWLRFYQPLWEAGFHLTSRFPMLRELAQGLRALSSAK